MPHAPVAPIIPSRRSLLAASGVVGAMALAACGPNAGSAADPNGSDAGDGSASLRMTWWGSDSRTELTQQVVDAYATATPDVTITTEPAEFSAYWDKLATQTAATNAPDIIQMVDPYLTEYAARGALYDQSSLDIDTSGFTGTLGELGTVEGAGKVGLVGGSNAPVLMANPALFTAAGLDLPDDTTWTWDDLLSLAADIAEAGGDGTYGTAQYVTNPVVFELWLRQRDQEIWRDGAVGFDLEAATSFYEFAGSMLSASYAPSAAISQEDYTGGIESSLFATGRLGMSVVWSNQTVAYATAMEEDVALLRLPAASGQGGDAKSWLKPGVYWSIPATCAAPQAAADFISYFLNDPEAGATLGVDRGVPPNGEVRDALKESLTGTELATIEFIETVGPEAGEDPEAAPLGGSVYETLLGRVGESFMYGEVDAKGAAQQMIDELTAAIS